MLWSEDRAGANTEVGGNSEHQTLTSRNCCGGRKWKPGSALGQGALLQLSCSQTALLQEGREQGGQDHSSERQAGHGGAQDGRAAAGPPGA